MSELVFVVEEAPEGGYIAKARGGLDRHRGRRP
jgi:hypothetical protein